MSDPSSFDLSSATGLLIVVVMMIAVAIGLIPALLHMVWQALPGILVLWLIVVVLRGMVQRLLG